MTLKPSATSCFAAISDELMEACLGCVGLLKSLMLDAAAGAVAAGGALVYAVCSLEPEEGEEQVAAFLERQPYWRIDAIGTDEVPAGLSVADDGWLRIAPPDLAEAGGADGFFMVRLVRG